MLKKVSQIVAVASVLAVIAQPLASCIMPGHTMTAAEHACCAKMASMCDSSAMPTSHSCCKIGVSPSTTAAAKIGGSDILGIILEVGGLAPALPQTVRTGDLSCSDSPPGSPPKLSTVLRI